MILDDHLVFSDAQAITVDAISDVIDRGLTAPTLSQIGGGFAGDLFLVVQTGTALATGTSLKIDFVSDSTANLATSPTTHIALGTWLTAALTANTLLGVWAIPPGDYERFVGLKYDVTGTYDAGSIKAFLTRDPQYWRAMASDNPIAS